MWFHLSRFLFVYITIKSILVINQEDMCVRKYHDSRVQLNNFTRFTQLEQEHNYVDSNFSKVKLMVCLIM